METNMLINAKIALSLALFVATASGAMAASKHAVRHHSPMAHSATTYVSFGSARPRSRRVVTPTYMNKQEIPTPDFSFIN
jgi:hypothetical protein